MLSYMHVEAYTLDPAPTGAGSALPQGVGARSEHRWGTTMQTVIRVIELLLGKAEASDGAPPDAAPYMKRLSDIAGNVERIKIQPARTFEFKRQTFGLKRAK